jgi:hypothetical protein
MVLARFLVVSLFDLSPAGVSWDTRDLLEVDLSFSSPAYFAIILAFLDITSSCYLVLMRKRLVIIACVMWLTDRPWHVFTVTLSKSCRAAGFELLLG